ncbi:MAG TPA: chorismate mutase [Amycolatopsis sp.]|uniref:chorismate mutase n=1 Tax=Amycolatopsis sp. TaxID=37632 RepID=UPI002B4952F5|nr:chorismate mutase [Amycolatopsis sp.]HKS43777.1 chorismate mutase [Amycolatopsis sp.]
MRVLITVLAVAFSVAVPATASAAPTRSLLPLIESSADRVRLADQVAAAKFGTTQPIDDPAREQQVLDAMAAKAPSLGLDPAAVTTFFRDQIEANKIVQRGRYAYWTAHPDRAPTSRPDLSAIRPRIDQVNNTLLQELSDIAPARTNVFCDARVLAGIRLVDAERHFGPLHSSALTRSLRSTCAPS